MRLLVLLLFAIGFTHCLSAAPVAGRIPGAFTSAGGTLIGNNVANIGSLGQLGVVMSASRVQAFGGFAHTEDSYLFADTDGDGLSDAYDVDNDNDGASDTEELIAGTGLLDAADVLRITSIERRPDGVSISWPAQPGRTYRILRLDTPGAILPSMQGRVHANIQSKDSDKSARYIDRDAASGYGFYRVEVVP